MKNKRYSDAQIEAVKHGGDLELRVPDLKANVVTMSAQAR